LAALLLVRLADELFAFLPAGTLAQIQADFHLSYAQAGMLLMVLPAGGILGTAFTVAADHVSRRLLSAVGAAAIGASLLAFGLSPWFAGLLLAAAAWGAAGDAFISGAEIALVDVSGDHLTTALGRQNFLAAIGDLLSPAVLMVAALLRIGWRALFVGSAVLMFGYSWWLSSEDLPGPQDDDRSVRRGILQVLRDRRVWALAAGEALVSIIDEPYLAFLILFLEQVQHAPPPIAVSVTLADLLGSAAGSYLAPRGLKRQPALLPIAGLCLAAAIAVLIWAPWLPVQYAASALAGLSAAAIWVAIQGRVLGLRPGQAGTTSAVTGTVALLSLPFPWVAGLLADRFGLGAAMVLYLAVGVVLALLLLSMSSVAIFMPPPGSSSQAPGGSRD
jgi:predicted MFS family arabinose efflux permease